MYYKVTWRGVFVSNDKGRHVSNLQFEGNNMQDILLEIREFIDCIQDDGKWKLDHHYIVKITKDASKRS
jgi:hypothetical protein